VHRLLLLLQLSRVTSGNGVANAVYSFGLLCVCVLLMTSDSHCQLAYAIFIAVIKGGKC
jgi:hypothetical protein